ncbi:hypothetical protein VSR01_09660 [Actinacidiphila sp. DG2A-62]|uniref:hypothetical protein n=1 Tax=Actinacidiphila sp. DG2A-62 TaxID=3108821 RepID=UPI002DBD32E3|nr:hypothetical protein [Actinacidiphila sp. DG2A-62]MEC3993792.1 hypothetical protein [Actinacidiphila sp. DG2A-62]
MTTLVKQTQDMADKLSGGITGDYDVPQQLANDAATLRYAIMRLEDIDSWYAMKALQWAHAHLRDITMDDGRVAVSQVPGLSDRMSADMRAVMSSLADHYRVTIENAAYSTPPDNPANGSGGPGPTDSSGYGDSGDPVPYPDMGSGGGGYLPDFGSSGPDNPTSYPDVGSAGDGGNLPDFGSSGPGSAVPYPGGGDSGAGGGQVPDFAASGSPAPYPGGGSDGAGGNLPDFGDTGADSPVPYPGGDTGAVGGLPGLGGDGPGGVDGGLPSDYPGVQDYQGNPSLGNGGSLPGDGLPGDGTLDPTMDAALNPGGTAPVTGDMPGPVPYPGLSLGTGTGGGKTGASEDTGKGLSPYPDSADDFGTGSVGSPGSVDLPGYSGPSEASGYPGSDLPALNTTGTAAPNLGEQFQPYPDTSLASDPAGQIAGSPGTLGSSMPMMPMGGMGSGAGGAGAGGSDVPSSDASGLLQGSAQPWLGDTSLGGAGGLPDGTASGGPGLDLPNPQSVGNGLGGLGGLDGLDTLAFAADTPAQGVGGPGTVGSSMPMMPMGGMGSGAGGAGAGGSDVPSSDASGLLQGSAQPWLGDTSLGGAGGLPDGTAPGGPGLDLPGPQSSHDLLGGDTSVAGSGGLSGGLSGAPTSGAPGLDLPGGPSSPAGPDGLVGLDGSAADGGTPAQGPGATAASTPMMPMGGMGGMGGGTATATGPRPTRPDSWPATASRGRSPRCGTASMPAPRRARRRGRGACGCPAATPRPWPDPRPDPRPDPLLGRMTPAPRPPPRRPACPPARMPPVTPHRRPTSPRPPCWRGCPSWRPARGAPRPVPGRARPAARTTAAASGPRRGRTRSGKPPRLRAPVRRTPRQRMMPP